MFGAKKRLRKMLENSFGENPLESYLFYNAGQRLANVRRYHSAIEEAAGENWKVDDITWNDLEMDQIFLRINHTNSFIGEQTLYHKLHLLDKGKNPKAVERLEKRLTYLEKNPETRLAIETQINYIGKNEEGYYLPEFLLNSEWWQVGNTLLFHGLQALFLICLIGSIAFQSVIAIAGLVCAALINLMIYLTGL